MTANGENTPILTGVSPPEIVVDEPVGLGEGVLWHEQERALFWVDIETGRLFRFDPAAGSNELVYRHHSPVGGFTIQADGSFILFCGQGEIVRWAGGDVEQLVPEIAAERNIRFNDVIATPAGDVFAGTVPPAGGGPARFYRLSRDRNVSLLIDSIGLSNGCGFNGAENVLYHTDSDNRQINRYSYREGESELGPRQPFIETPEDGSVPDGMTVDAEDNIWSARFGGWGVYTYDPTGALLGKLDLPVRNVTNIAFGGPELATAYITTAGGDRRGEELGALAGSMFAVDLGVRGKPEYLSSIQ